MTVGVVNRTFGGSAAGRSPRWLALAAVGAVLSVGGCSTGTLATPETSPAAINPSSSVARSVAGPTVVVTVPDLVTAGAGSASRSAPPAAATPTRSAAPTALSSELTSSVARNPSAAADAPAAGSQPQVSTPEPTTAPSASPAPAPPAGGQGSTTAPPAPSGDGLNVSLANCDGCTVLATHRNVTGDLSAALVGTGPRAILLSVAANGAAAGVINVPYGSAFPEPDGGVLACAESRCVVQGRQPDGRSILSAFELTGTGAWRDVSGDDAFPSATEQGAVVDIGGSLAIAVQDQADAGAVWLLYTWSGDRYVVVGCSADGSAPTSVDAVSPDRCLS